jgi:hypothetical protein
MNVFKCSVLAGVHKFTVVAGPNSVIDLNDVFTITVFEYQVN